MKIYKETLIFILAIIFFVSGIFVVYFITKALPLEDLIYGRRIDKEYTSIVGNFLSGTVGVLWSGAGVFLYYAALNYQRKELKEVKDSRSDQVSQNLHFQLFNQFNLKREYIYRVNLYQIRKVSPMNTLITVMDNQGENLEDKEVILDTNIKVNWHSYCELFFSILENCNRLGMNNPEFYERMITNTLYIHDIRIIESYVKYIKPQYTYLLKKSSSWNERKKFLSNTIMDKSFFEFSELMSL